jgi:hexosaminidase
MNKTLLGISIMLLLTFCSEKLISQHHQLIPQPVAITFGEGVFELEKRLAVLVDDGSLQDLATYASSLWTSTSRLSFQLNEATEREHTKGIYLVLLESYNDTLGDEGYQIHITTQSVVLTANTASGLFYAVHTLNQLIFSAENGHLKSCNIIDYPRFDYRGMHLDVSRHFMPIGFIYEVLDYMAMHKLNVFHWHLIDDQGWRLEIKKYPELTKTGAWRVPMTDRHWNDRPLVNDPESATYGGFYTQDEVKAVVSYAAARNITIIPEIEMPAHVMSALAAYPQLSCTGENLGVPPGGVWPITHIYCAGNDSTFIFLEDVLHEVMALFPAEFIHIGGDEADKTNWKSCKKCQNRMATEGLHSEEELQAYFIRRIEKFLNAHGRKLIGWDEILEGGLPPNAAVMSWRGEKGGIEAAQMGHQVVMTPGSHCYFDHYQGDPAIEPLAIGGHTTLAKVYAYEPIPEELNADQAKLILGAQANVWTEYMPTPSHVEYMVFPRLAALSEVLWSPKEARDWGNFSKRMETQYKRYDSLGIHYALSAFQVQFTATPKPDNKQLFIELHTQTHEPEIRYTLDGSIPKANSTLYEMPIQLKASASLKAAVFQKGRSMQQVLTRDFDLHKAFGIPVQLRYPNSSRYDGGGPFGLADGTSGSSDHNDGYWTGFSEVDMVATIDLGQIQPIETIAVDALQNYASWIFFPETVTFEGSADGENFVELDQITNTIPVDQKGKLTQLFSARFESCEMRYIRIKMKNIGQCPPGHSGEGKPAWLFSSEVIVY